MNLIKKGSTDVTRYIMLRDSTAGTPETGYTITSLDLQYTRNRTAPATKVDATALAATDSAHGDNQAIEIDGTSSPGLYRVDWPDAAFATGVDKVVLVVSGTGLDPAIEEIQLVDFDPADGVRLGLTALPNAAADGAGGLPISDAGGLDLDAIKAKTDSLTFTVAGDVDVNVQSWGGSAIATPSVAGVPEVDLTHVAGTTTNVSALATNVDAILTDTGTTLQAELDGIQADTEDIQSRLPAALVSGRMDASVGAYQTGLTPLQPTTAGRTLDVTTGGCAGIDWANVEAPTTTVNLSNTAMASVVAVTADVNGNLVGNVGGNVNGSIGSLATQAKADVNAEVVDVMATDTHAEQGQGNPPATTTYAVMIGYIYKSWRNKKDNDGSTTQLYADDGTTVDQKQTTSESGGTVTKGEWVTGP